MQFELITETPESLGIPSGAVEAFLDELTDKKLCMHSFLLLRHGKIAAEGYWPPFNQNRKQRIYSISKSFTAIAVGMMINEGKLSLDSKVSDYFPEYLPLNPHPYVLETRVRDLLMMATCNDNYPYTADTYNSLEIFFNGPGAKHKPGNVFQYDTVGTTVLCAIMEKLSGKPLLEYMRPVLDEIGFSRDVYCIKIKEGYSWTGSGIVCTSRDLARFALLCMNNGEWNGKQLLDSDYIRAATSRQIDNSVNNFGLEYSYGYGYQIWALRRCGFFMYGMGSQYALCNQENGTILITTADTQGVEGAGELIFDMYFRLIKKFSVTALEEDEGAQKRLKDRIGKLSIPLPCGKTKTPLAHKLSGRKYILDKNEAGMKWMCLIIEGDKSRFQYANESGEHELVFGMGKYEQQEFPEKYFGERISIRDTHYSCIGAGAWTDDNAFLGTIYAIGDYLGSIRFQLTFAEDEVCGCMAKAAEWFFDEYQGFLTGHALKDMSR